MAKKTTVHPNPSPPKADFPNLPGRQGEHSQRESLFDELCNTLAAGKKAIEDLHKEKQQLRDSITQLDGERKGLQGHVEKLRQEKEKLEQEDNAFAQEHLRHDKVVRERIQQAKQLADEILKLAKG